MHKDINMRNATELSMKLSDIKQRLEEASGKKLDVAHPVARHIFIALDCSYSMVGDDKLSQAKAGVLNFSTEAMQRGYDVGIIAFSSQASCPLALTRKVDDVSTVLDTLNASGSTDMAGAIQLGIENLSKSNRPGDLVICIVTDGMPDSQADTLSAAQDAKRKKIDIMAIGTDDADMNFLSRIVTRNELSVYVKRHQLKQGISDMVLLLPKF